MKNTAVVICFLLLVLNAHAQQDSIPSDTPVFRSLAEIIVNGFEQARRLQYHTASVHVIRNDDADRYNKTSLVQGFNTVPGVRMEERSPGSYRINIRGSSLRSPFGVRNVKVYWNEIPITDPGGNTYFNQFAFNNFSSIEIYKGPAGSMYGAGTGGLILANSLDASWRPGASIEYVTGSFGLQNVLASARLGGNNNRSQLTFSHSEHDGYRQQSAMRRNNASWTSSFKINNRQELRTNVLFTDMYYQTPGGLTKAEFEKDPGAARPAAGGLPGAVQAKAAIYQKNFLAAIQHRYNIDSNWTNATSLYVAYAQIRNPTVRNYERRSEPHVGGRTVFTRQLGDDRIQWKLLAGGELQRGFFNTKVYQNRQGVSDTLQTDDDIQYHVYSAFAQVDVSLMQRLSITAGTSINSTKVEFTRLNTYPAKVQSRKYKQEWAPRIAAVLRITKGIAAFASVARGFSPPSIAELLPSTSVVSTFLEAEKGTNYEAGIRHTALANRLYLVLSGYYFRLNNTLVQRRDNNGADFFINAGNTKQKGVEASAEYIVRNLSLKAAYTHASYKYGSFTRDTIDLSGKKLPSVPANTISLLADAEVKGLYANASYYYASKIFLNDLNTASAEGYHLLGLRLGWKKTFNKKLVVNIYAGADNLLDEVYSLGNDINDARGRYYNTAAERNYYGGVSFQFVK
jgi:iron complex outermembrane recepter protein